ncbi:HAD-IIIA family hydrolase [Allostreptomyces psammosilenae]|uniref:D,D-heptose 1,7-bisphosphate phosphatase n=1 Tax=Allostreptomyces psammosilenae TaxID=1892865 RepID=A0A852ZNS6_9ACTN|nr:histidinol-phosphate phosphatase family protein [Allostreptomyces psammosilenae]
MSREPRPARERAGTPDYSVVVPTLGRPSLDAFLRSLAETRGPRPRAVVLVDDRPDTPVPLRPSVPGPLAGRLTVPACVGGRGPAAARNTGWRAAPPTEWIVFLDDDVLVGPDWAAELAEDLAAAGPDVGGVQGRLTVPLPGDRRPTDWERGTASLATSRWITADMAYRRDALVETGGFDERFRRAFREDADLALRVADAGFRLERGRRHTRHPVRPPRRFASLRAQAGNADDVLMERLHGPDWYRRADAPRGRIRRHRAVTAAAVAALGLGVLGHRRLAVLAAAGWLAGTAEFAAARISPGPGDRAEVAEMALTSLLIPPAAVAHRLRGRLTHRDVGPWPGRPAAVLLDRDGTLVRDVPYNNDPEKVEPVPGARAALDALRAAGLRVGVVSNQSGVARGLISPEQLAAVNARLEELLGPFDTWAVCPHGDADGCDCRKPAPGLVHRAAADLGLTADRCVVVGDIGADIAAARAAGARGLLVPTEATRPEETLGVRTARDLPEAVRRILEGLR